MKPDKFAKAINMADKAATNPARAVMSAPSQIRTKPAFERHDRKVHTFLTHADYDKLVARIGRTPLSHVLRDLVHDFLKRSHGS
jgi:hypothetical protein